MPFFVDVFYPGNAEMQIEVDKANQDNDPITMDDIPGLFVGNAGTIYLITRPKYHEDREFHFLNLRTGRVTYCTGDRLNFIQKNYTRAPDGTKVTLIAE